MVETPRAATGQYRPGGMSTIDTMIPETVRQALDDPSYASLLAAGAPVLVAEGSPFGMIWASEGALALFGASNAEALTPRLLASADPGAKRLVELSRSLLPGAAARMERLRFFLDGHAQMITFLCRRPSGANTPLVAAALGVRPKLPAPSATISNIAPRPAIDRELLSPATSQQVESTEPAAVEPEANAGKPRSLADVVANLGAGQPAPSRLRFTWLTDAEGRLTQISDSFASLLGATPGDLIGLTAAELNQRISNDAVNALATAVEERKTFSGLELLCRLGQSGRAAPIVFGGSPALDRDRTFAGMRGFGVAHLDRATEIEAAEPAQAGPASNSDVDDIETETPTEAGPVEAAETAPAANSNDNVAVDEENSVSASEAPEPEDVDEQTLETGASAENHAAIADEADTEFEAASADAIHQESALAGQPEVTETERTPEPSLGGNVVPLRPRIPSRSAAPTMLDPEPELPLTAPPAPIDRPDLRLETPVVIADPPAASNLEPTPSAMRETPASAADAAGFALSQSERNAFREIAKALGARVRDESEIKAEQTRAESVETPAESVKPTPVEAKRRETEEGLARIRDLLQISTPEEAEHAAPSEIETMTALPLSAPAHSELTPVAAVASGGLSANAEALFDRLPYGLLVSRGGTPIYANRCLRDLLGYEDVDALHDAGGLDRLFRGREPDALTRESDGGAIPVVTADNQIAPLEVRMQTLEWDNEPASLITFRRTSEPEATQKLKGLELELRQRDAERRELHAILDTATDGVLTLDNAGRILGLNRSAEALFGYEQNEIAGESITALLAQESHSAALEYFNGLKTSGVASVMNDGREVIGRARQGGAIPMFMTIGRLASGDSSKFCAVLRDITSWKRAERELKEARRDAERASALKSDFLAKISHEIRTPLNAILGFAEVIMEERFGPVGNERYKDYLKDIHSSGTHVMSLVNDLLDLSKIEAGKVDLNFGAVDANRIITECVSLLQTQAHTERVIVRLALAPRLPNVVADERSMKQIVLNLLSNALKFNEPGGQVIISTALTDSGSAVIRIKDTGIGMTDADVETALEPFRQIATSRQTTGTGLGLPLTKALVEANRATFSIRSKKKEGTLVEVTFPPTRVLAE